METLGEEAAHRIRRGTVVTATALVAALLPWAGCQGPGLRATARSSLAPWPSAEHTASASAAAAAVVSDVEQAVVAATERAVEFEVLCDWCSWLAGDRETPSHKQPPTPPLPRDVVERGVLQDTEMAS